MTALIQSGPVLSFYSVGQIVGMPAWLEGNDDRYVVDAKVDDVDLADWQNPAKQPAMLRSMLQALAFMQRRWRVNGLSNGRAPMALSPKKTVDRRTNRPPWLPKEILK